MNSFQIVLIAQLVWLFYKDTPLISWGWFFFGALIYVSVSVFFEGLGKALGNKIKE